MRWIGRNGLLAPSHDVIQPGICDIFAATQLAGFGAGGSSSLTMLEIVQTLGLTTNLKLCLDAGDASSFTSGQSWLDRSGNGYDWFLGAGSGGSTDDPTFNGTVGGKSKNEYFSFSGDDCFTYDTANETWMNNIHKDNARFTLLWAFLPGGTNGTFWVDFGNAPGQAGFRAMWVSSGAELDVVVANAGANALVRTSSTLGMHTADWNIGMVSIDEAAGASGSFFMGNGKVEIFDGTYTLPNASNAVNTVQISANQGGSVQFPSGSRLTIFAAWEGVALMPGQAQSVFSVLRERFAI